MNAFVEKIKSFEDFFCGKGTNTAAIASAEKQLGLRFSEEYKSYLSECGVASADGHEFTGIIGSARLNVVDVTKNARLKNTSVPDALYVVEEIQIDKITIWQSTNGEVFQTVGTGAPAKVASSLAEYVSRA